MLVKATSARVSAQVIETTAQNNATLVQENGAVPHLSLIIGTKRSGENSAINEKIDVCSLRSKPASVLFLDELEKVLHLKQIWSPLSRPRMARRP